MSSYKLFFTIRYLVGIVVMVIFIGIQFGKSSSFLQSFGIVLMTVSITYESNHNGLTQVANEINFALTEGYFNRLLRIPLLGTVFQTPYQFIWLAPGSSGTLKIGQ